MPKEYTIDNQPNTHATDDAGVASASPNAIIPKTPAAKIHLHPPEEKTMQVLKRANQYDKEHRPSSSLLDVMFQSKEARKVEMMKCKTIHEKYDFELRVLHTFHDAQMELIQEKYQAFLLEEKTKIRKERAAFFQEQLDDLTNSMSRKNREFLKRIHEEYQALEEIPAETLRKKQEEFIEKSVDRYYDTATQLIEHFQSLLNDEGKQKR